MYSPQLLDHFQNPRNAGDVANPDAAAEVENPVCGDVVRMSMKVQKGKITEVRFKARGCVPAMACASALTELVLRKDISEAHALRREDVIAAVGDAMCTHALRSAVASLRACVPTPKLALFPTTKPAEMRSFYSGTNSVGSLYKESLFRRCRVGAGERAVRELADRLSFSKRAAGENTCVY